MNCLHAGAEIRASWSIWADNQTNKETKEMKRRGRAHEDGQNMGGEMKERAACGCDWKAGGCNSTFQSAHVWIFVCTWLFFFFLKGKVGQDKLQASTHAEQHPHTRQPGGASAFSHYTFSSTYSYFSFSLFSCLCFVIPPLIRASIHIHPWASLSPSFDPLVSPQ